MNNNYLIPATSQHKFENNISQNFDARRFIQHGEMLNYNYQTLGPQQENFDVTNLMSFSNNQSTRGSSGLEAFQATSRSANSLWSSICFKNHEAERAMHIAVEETSSQIREIQERFNSTPVSSNPASTCTLNNTKQIQNIQDGNVENKFDHSKTNEENDKPSFKSFKNRAIRSERSTFPFPTIKILNKKKKKCNYVKDSFYQNIPISSNLESYQTKWNELIKLTNQYDTKPQLRTLKFTGPSTRTTGYRTCDLSSSNKAKKLISVNESSSENLIRIRNEFNFCVHSNRIIIKKDKSITRRYNNASLQKSQLRFLSKMRRDRIRWEKWKEKQHHAASSIEKKTAQTLII